MTAQPRRWADLPPAERERRQQQSQADKTRAAAAAGTPTASEVSDSATQRRADRDQGAGEHLEAMYRTVLSGDVNFMDKHDW